MTTPPMTKKQTIDYLVHKYDKTRDVAGRIFDIAMQTGLKNEPFARGYLTVIPTGNGKVTIEENAKNAVLGVAGPPQRRYTSRNSTTAKTNDRRKAAMPARPRKPAVAAPEPEVEEPAGRDPELFLTKELTPTQADYVEWLADTLGDLGDLEWERVAFVAVSLYSDFQKSDFNKDRKEERRNARTARVAANGDAEEDDEEPEAPAKPARRGKTAAAAPAAPARPARGGKATATAAPAGKRGRGRPAAEVY